MVAVRTDPLQNIVNVSWGGGIFVQILFTGSGPPAGGNECFWGNYSANSVGANGIDVFVGGVAQMWVEPILGGFGSITVNNVESAVWTGPNTDASPPVNLALYSNELTINWIFTLPPGIPWGSGEFALPFTLAIINVSGNASQSKSASLAGYWGTGVPSGLFDPLNRIVATASPYDVPFSARGADVGTEIFLNLVSFTGGIPVIEFVFNTFEED
jgi:hypothetical protein